MKKLFILAALAIFSQASFATETAYPTCPAGTKLAHNAYINIKDDGSGEVVDHPYCEQEEKAKDTSADKTADKGKVKYEADNYAGS